MDRCILYEDWRKCKDATIRLSSGCYIYEAPKGFNIKTPIPVEERPLRVQDLFVHCVREWDCVFLASTIANFKKLVDHYIGKTSK